MTADNGATFVSIFDHLINICQVCKLVEVVCSREGMGDKASKLAEAAESGNLDEATEILEERAALEEGDESICTSTLRPHPLRDGNGYISLFDTNKK